VSSSINCAECTSRACVRGGAFPEGCPSVVMPEVVRSGIAKTALDAFACRVMAAASAAIRTDDGNLRNRMEETIALCKEMGFLKIGIAFCVALAKEARVVASALSNAGFEVVPVCCKVGRVGFKDLCVETACHEKGSSCNPVTQAEIMNAHATDLNIVLGLCVGHDILFARYSRSPITTLVVKDRALRHNPIAAMQEHKEITIA